MRLRILVMVFLLGVATAAPAQVNIGINISLFPELVQVPGYPVYYAPRHDANYFFYDGLYWCSWTMFGIRATGTTALGIGSRPTMCRFICCGSRCATTGTAGVFPRLAA